MAGSSACDPQSRQFKGIKKPLPKEPGSGSNKTVLLAPGTAVAGATATPWPGGRDAAAGRFNRAIPHLLRELLQRGDPVLGCRVGREQVVHTRAAQRIDDEHVRGCWVVLRHVVGNGMCGCIEPVQCRSEPFRLACDL